MESKQDEKNLFYLNFVIETNKHCMNLCVANDNITNKDLTKDESNCLELCFAKYYKAYEFSGFKLIN